jgi:uncharacterized protein YndB with AHSA1/START domain
LISEPAWWVGEAGPDHVSIVGNRIVAECKYGSFPVIIEKIEASSSLVCHWASSFPGEEPIEGKGTCLTFALVPSQSGTLLSVTETGFAHLDASETEQGQFYNENTSGWTMQLNAVKQKAE